MPDTVKTSHLVLSGGGVKGIAYVGALDVAHDCGYRWINTGGVSAGAIIGAILSAGYAPEQIRELLDQFDFKKVNDKEVTRKIPVINNFKRYAFRNSCGSSYIGKQEMRNIFFRTLYEGDVYAMSARGTTFIGKLGELCLEQSLYNGDYIEQWMAEKLSVKGIRTFGDLKGNVISPSNRKGYRTRMIAVDTKRAKVITLPDDLLYYGIDPDSFEVAKAVRMSTSAPFIFKPVELKYKKDGMEKTTYIIDGGVLDNFPTWLFNKSTYPLVGFSLSGVKTTFNFSSPLNILKSVTSIVYDFGIPKDISYLDKFVDIDTSQVSTFDFNLDQSEKRYLYNAGKAAAEKVLR